MGPTWGTNKRLHGQLQTYTPRSLPIRLSSAPTLSREASLWETRIYHFCQILLQDTRQCLKNSSTRLGTKGVPFSSPGQSSAQTQRSQVSEFHMEAMSRWRANTLTPPGRPAAPAGLPYLSCGGDLQAWLRGGLQVGRQPPELLADLARPPAPQCHESVRRANPQH